MAPCEGTVTGKAQNYRGEFIHVIIYQKAIDTRKPKLLCFLLCVELRDTMDHTQSDDVLFCILLYYD